MTTPNKNSNNAPVNKINKKITIPTASKVLRGGELIEMIYRPSIGRTSFVISKKGVWGYRPNHKLDDKQILVPYSGSNNLIKNDVILFPSTPSEYGTEESLITDIKAYIHKYVDVSPRFEKLACYYVLFSWLYDNFNELPYLRVRGDFGTGKTRFLLTVGALTYKPIFASGASTISPLFYMLDAFRGTLIIDEGDFRLSDEKTDIIKILNNGNVRGIPVLRNEQLLNHEYNPRAFHVYGPKIISTRGKYQDDALESRFITEEMGTRKLRGDIPINLPLEYKEEAQKLRNKLLMFRLRNYGQKMIQSDLADLNLASRINQIFVPLMSVIRSKAVQQEIHDLAVECNSKLVTKRMISPEVRVLSVIHELLKNPEIKKLSVKEITGLMVERHGEEYRGDITARWVGSIIRTKLGLMTKKSHGCYVIPDSELPKLAGLHSRFQID